MKGRRSRRTRRRRGRRESFCSLLFDSTMNGDAPCVSLGFLYAETFSVNKGASRFLTLFLSPLHLHKTSICQ